MSNEYLSNDFPAPVEVCKCGRYASIDCMIAVSDGYKCISCIEKEMHDRIPKTNKVDKDQIIVDLSEYLDGLIAEYEDGYGDVGQIIDELDKMITKYRKGGGTN